MSKRLDCAGSSQRSGTDCGPFLQYCVDQDSAKHWRPCLRSVLRAICLIISFSFALSFSGCRSSNTGSTPAISFSLIPVANQGTPDSLEAGSGRGSPSKTRSACGSLFSGRGRLVGATFCRAPFDGNRSRFKMADQHSPGRTICGDPRGRILRSRKDVAAVAFPGLRSRSRGHGSRNPVPSEIDPFQRI
jgi:hypothetical protein